MKSVNTKEFKNILIVEDDPGDQKLLKMSFKETRYSIVHKFIEDGESAINFILESSPQTSLRFDLIFLDLNLPKKNGIEVLKALKNSEFYRKIPVIIFTTSINKNDIDSALTNYASGYFRKPASIDEYEKIINSIFQYWFELGLI
jgi:CheY-like chemotaxis protein